MPIQKQLNDFRNAFPNCSAVGLIDISSGVVLCVSTATKRPQEQLDALCAAAAQFFKSDTSTAFSTVLGVNDTRGVQEAVLLNDSQTCLFLRSPVDSMEAMFCLCAPQIDIVSAMTHARKTLNRIAIEG